MNDLKLLAKIDTSGAIKFLKDAREAVLISEQQAVNTTAVEVQKFTTGTLLPDKFTLRSRGAPWQRPGTAMGFNIKFAKKPTDGQNPEASIGSRADWLKLHEEGGTKKVAGHRVAAVAEARDTKTSVLSVKNKPRRILARKGDKTGKNGTKIVRKDGAGFELPFKSGRASGIFIRESKDKVKLMYSLLPQTKIKKTLSYAVEGGKIVRQRFEPNFNYAFARLLALKTSKV